jgi:hypothetical protein
VRSESKLLVGLDLSQEMYGASHERMRVGELLLDRYRVLRQRLVAPLITDRSRLLLPLLWR